MKVKRIKKKCVICNRKYYIIPSQNKRSKSCSEKCRLIWLQQYLKKNNKSFYNRKFQKEMSKRANYNPIKNKRPGVIAQKTLKEKKVSAFYDPKIQLENTKKGLLTNRRKKGYSFFNIFFDTLSEVEIAMNIYYQFNVKPIERKNCHIFIGEKEYDFFILGCFIEERPFTKRYYQIRRENLNKNGFKDYPLLIITTK